MKKRVCSDENINRVLQLAQKLLLCADDGDESRSDEGCGVLYAIVRDCAYKIENAALKEKEVHRLRGIV